jgi:hypothetical protein
MMKPADQDKRLGRLTLEQFLGLGDGMSFKVAGRMIALAGDYTTDLIALREDGMDPRHTCESLARLARRATRTESALARLLVLAAQHCADQELADVPQAIRSNMKTAGRCRSAICLMAMSAQQHARDERLAA